MYRRRNKPNKSIKDTVLDSGVLKAKNVIQGKAEDSKAKAENSRILKGDEGFQREPQQNTEGTLEHKPSNWDIAIEKVRENIRNRSESSNEKQEKKKKKGQEKGLARICEIAEDDGVISKKDVITFLDDLKLPPISCKVLESEMKIAGASELGFGSLENFFVFVRNQLRNFTFEETIGAFKLFDKNDENVIDLLCLRGIVSLLGDVLSHDEVDDIMRRADLDGEGSVTYEEVTKQIFANEEKLYNWTNGK